MIRLYLWPHRLLLLGPSLEATRHRHHAAQLCVGLEGRVSVRSEPEDSWRSHAALYVPPDVTHEFRADGSAIAMVYVEVESAEFAALQAHLHRPQTVTALPVAPAAVMALRRLASTGSDIESADHACRSLTGVPAAAERHPDLDRRILDAVKIVQSSIDRPIRLKQLAQSVNVSTSWLSHQFSREIGVPLRRYVLWQRLRRAVEISLAGATLTEAAHSAGFSDAAHLSRTFRATFGISPSFLFEHREQIGAMFAS